MTPLNPLKRALAEDRATLGYLVSMPSVQLVQALARTGVDWLMIDTEHAPISIESVAAMIAATGGTPATPLVRVPGVGADLVKPILDCGALGVVFPQVATRADAEATVRAVRYAPAGRRGYGPTYAALRWGLEAASRHLGAMRRAPAPPAPRPGPDVGFPAHSSRLRA